MRALWLPGVLRAAGLTVHEVPGWRTRGRDSWGPVRGITCHHTAGSRNSSIQGEINVLLNGSTSAPPPIAQLFLARNGEWYVVASGHCNHNRVGWDGPNEGYGNDALLGIEAQHSGAGEPWTPTQYSSYVRGVAALVRHDAPGWNVTVSRVAGHKEHQPGSKTDPTFNMDVFRRNVADEIRRMDNPQPPKQEEDDMTPEENWKFDVGSMLGKPKYSAGGLVWNAKNATDYLAYTFAPAVLTAIDAVAAGITALDAENETDHSETLAKIETAKGELLAAIEGIPADAGDPLDEGETDGTVGGTA